MVSLILCFAGGAFCLAAALLEWKSGGGQVRKRIAAVAGNRTENGAAVAVRTRTAGPRTGRETLAARVLLFGMKRPSGLTGTPSSTLVIAVLGAITAVGLALFLGLPALAAVGAVPIGAFLPARFFANRQQQKAKRQFIEAFPDILDSLARMLRVGVPISSAIQSVGLSAPEPASSILKGISNSMTIGVTLTSAVDEASRQIDIPDFRFFAVAVALQQSTGGNLVSSLDILSQIIRRRRAIQRKAKAVSGEARFSAYILGALPFFTLGALFVIQPEYLTPLLMDPRGHIILGMSAGGLALSAAVIGRMMKSVTAV